MVFINHDYAIISEKASRSYGLPETAYGWEDAPIDFVGVAKLLNIAAKRATTPAEMERIINEAQQIDEPTFIEVLTDPIEP